MEKKDIFSVLSVLEIKILEFIRTGLTNEEIARALYISPKTVAKYITELLEKTGLKNRVQLAVSYQIYISELKSKL